MKGNTVKGNAQPQVSVFLHRGGKYLRIDFEQYNEDTKYRCKQIEGYRFSATHGCWYFPYTAASVSALQSKFPNLSLSAALLEDPDLAVNTKVKPASRGSIEKMAVEVTGTEDGQLKVGIPEIRSDWARKLEIIPGWHYNTQGKYWLLPHHKESIRLLNALFGQHLAVEKRLVPSFTVPSDSKAAPSGKIRRKSRVNWQRSTALPTMHQEALLAFEEQLLIERKSYYTIKSYLSHFTLFLSHFPNREAKDISPDQIRDYVVHIVKAKDYSASSQNQIINAIKAYYEKVLKYQRQLYKVSRPKKPLRLPRILTKDEVKRLFEATPNLKHRCILMVIYSAGLRISEAVNLRVRDIKKTRKCIFIRDGKGSKDRYTVLANTVVPVLDQYLKQYHPKLYLFEGQEGGAYSKRSIQAFFCRSRDRAGINPEVTVHSLRHSFATHSLDAGYSVRYIQEALGHNDIKTTERYLHVSSDALRNLRSPLDDLDV